MNSWQEARKKAQELILINRERKQFIYQKIEELNLPFTLFPYQKEGVYFLLQKKKCILADDMGLGKSIQVISALILGRIKRVLLICPKSVIKQWQTYLLSLNTSFKPELEIINYEKLYSQSQSYLSKIYDCIVLDEAQKIKNLHAKITQIILSFPETPYRWVITGTPIENNINEIIPSLLFIGEHQILENKYIDFFTINRILFQKMLRRVKQFDLTIEYIDLVFEMDKEILDFYDNLLCELYSKLEYFNILPILVKIRQFCACPFLFGYTKQDQRLFKIRSILKNHKERGEIGIIFTESKKIAQYLLTELQNNFVVNSIWGSKTKQQRKTIQDQFQNKEIDVLIMTKAGELGLNFQTGSFLIHYDIPYNPARIDQREGRILRIGQKNNIKIYFPYFKNSYEEKIFSIVSNKRILFNEIINTKKRRKIKLSKKMIEYLF